MNGNRASLAQRFAIALADCTPGRLRIGQEAYTAAFRVAEPSLVTAPDSRVRLEEAITDLVAGGIVRASRAVDRSELPPLPRFLVLLDRIADPPVDPEAARYPWRPELGWAQRLPLRRLEFEALRAIQTFLRDRASEALVVPAGERSLEIFGNEKRLDALRQNRRLFAPGRLSLELLRAQVYAPPFAYRKVSEGSVALVLENVATYHSVLATLPADSAVGIVVFGAGTNFGASVAYLAELVAEGEARSIRHIRYFGDLDRPGLQIPIAASRTAREKGLPPVMPAVGLWGRLLRHGRRAPDEVVDKETAERLVPWLPPSLRAEATEILLAGNRVAQEAVGMEHLSRNPGWADWEEIGPPEIESNKGGRP